MREPSREGSETTPENCYLTALIAFSNANSSRCFETTPENCYLYIEGWLWPSLSPWGPRETTPENCYLAGDGAVSDPTLFLNASETTPENCYFEARRLGHGLAATGTTVRNNPRELLPWLG